MQSIVFGLAATTMLSSCAALKNTPAQDLAWERWEKCKRFPYVSLKEIRPNGDIWVSYGQPDGYAQWKNCELAARAEQRAAGRFRSTDSPGSAEDVATIVSAAFFTAAPPSPNTYLTVFHNVERRDVFGGQVPVTFFYRLHQVGRILNVEHDGLDPMAGW